MNTFAATLSEKTENCFEGKTIDIPTKWIIKSVYLYMAIPIVIFFLGWLKWYFAIPCMTIFIVGLLFLFRSLSNDFSQKITLPIKDLIFILFFTFLWLYSTSIFFYQTWDQHYRNAILRDLIDFQWPVIYEETGNALVYYYAHWLVPALFGKLFGFTVANIVLLLQNIFGIILTFLCICIYIIPQKRTHVWIIFLILVFYGGINEIGFMWIDILGQGVYYMANGFGWGDMYYGYGYQYTPNDALLAWVYNQTIIPWMATMLFLLKPHIKYYAFLGLCVLPFGPLPFVGLFVIMVVSFIADFLKRKDINIWKDIFSIPNVCAIATIFPIFAFFYKTNVAAKHIGLYQVADAFGPKHIVFLIVFYFIEFGIYLLLIRKDYRNSALFLTVLISLCIIPHIQLGLGRDFGMRASIPALFIVMVLIIRYLINHDLHIKTPIISCLLVICLTVSGLGTVKDWANKIKAVSVNNWKPVVADDIKTFSDKQIGDVDWLENFLVPNPEDTIFFKYFAKS